MNDGTIYQPISNFFLVQTKVFASDGRHFTFFLDECSVMNMKYVVWLLV